MSVLVNKFKVGYHSCSDFYLVYFILERQSKPIMDQKHLRILRSNRVMIMRELPDLGALLGTPALKHHFSAYEKSQILTQSAPSDKAARFLEIMEIKCADVYERFLEAVRQFRPELALKLDEAGREASNSSNASSPASNGSSSPPCELECVCV